MRSSRRYPGQAATVAVTLAGALLACAARAQVNTGVPREMEGVGVTEQLGAQLPLDLEFTDESGRPVRLGDYFDGRRPVILTLNYYNCPLLCGLLLNGMLEAIKPLTWTPGQEYQLVTLSFDPLEGPSLARAKKQNYVNEYGRSAAAAGWHFLTGKREPIKALTAAVGFAYRWDEAQQQWMHPATLIVCTPTGKVSKYLGGVTFDPRTIRLALVEASEGKVGTFFDQIFLTCYHYDADAGRYVGSAVAFMRLGGGLTLAALAVTLVAVWRIDAARRARRGAGAELPPQATG
jgi:protein SCO1/2